MISFLTTEELGRERAGNQIGVAGIKGQPDYLRFRQYCVDHEITIYHCWPYYTDDDIVEITFRFDIDPISDQEKLLLTLSF